MIGQWKGKLGLEDLEKRAQGGQEKMRQGRDRKMEEEELEDRTEPHSLEDPQVARYLIARGQSIVVVCLSNLGVQLINIRNELHIICTGIFWVGNLPIQIWLVLNIEAVGCFSSETTKVSRRKSTVSRRSLEVWQCYP